MVRERYARGSSRSRGSSSTAEIAPREKIKDFCRHVVAFMCTQIGVGALVIGYTLVGAVSFMEIEKNGKNTKPQMLDVLRANYSVLFYRKVIERYGVIEKEKHIFIRAGNVVMKSYQEEVTKLFHRDYLGYEEKQMSDIWTLPAALMFSLSVITMIGYGNLVPRTSYGKIATAIYALFGIPLYVLYFLNVGDALASGFKLFYRKLYLCSTEKGDVAQKKVIVPSSACLWVISAYILMGSIIFYTWEHWEFLDSVYFCVTSLCKLGFGDYVPGANILEVSHGNQTKSGANVSQSNYGTHTKLVITYGYILFGLGLIAMCYNLMREEIKEKVKEVREDCAQCAEDTRLRFLIFCNRLRGIDDDDYY